MPSSSRSGWITVFWEGASTGISFAHAPPRAGRDNVPTPRPSRSRCQAICRSNENVFASRACGARIRRCAHKKIEEFTMDFYFDQDLKEFRGHIARWVDERLIPQADAFDRSAEFPGELFKELGGLG